MAHLNKCLKCGEKTLPKIDFYQSFVTRNRVRYIRTFCLICGKKRCYPIKESDFIDHQNFCIDEMMRIDEIMRQE